MNTRSLDNIAEDLFNKIRGRFPSVTIGNENGEVVNDPIQARFFDFDFKDAGKNLGKVSISVSEESLAVMYSNDFVENEDSVTRDRWYNFLKELRTFAKKRLLKFDTRDITKSNLNTRDYKFLAQRPGDGTMTESKLYGTSRISYQNIDNARLVIKHTESINQELATGRTQKIGKIYIESSEGERFKYPYKHLSGARAMARHVSEGGKPYDDFGKHIVGLSEEMSKLRKFKTYMGRSAVMAESLSEYMDVVKERIATVKKTVESLQKPAYYKEAVEGFEAPMLEDVPEDVAENWIDQLTIKQFNEELKDVFPFVYRLVSEATKAKIVSAADLLGEAPVDDVEVGSPAETYTVKPGDTLYSIAQKFQDANFQGADINDAVEEIMQLNNITNPRELRVGMELQMPYFMGAGRDGATRGLPPGGFQKYESELEGSFEEMMGQFGESDDEETDEGNKFTAALAKAKANDDDEMEVDGKKIPVTEFILSMYDRETGQFPKGETAVLTAVEKDYGEQFINPAKSFIEAINAKFEEFNGYRDPELMDDTDIQEANKEAGLNKIKMLYLQNQASDIASQDSIYAPGVKGAAPAGDVDKKAAMIARKYGITDQELAKIRLDALQSDADMAAMEDLTRLAGL